MLGRAGCALLIGACVPSLHEFELVGDAEDAARGLDAAIDAEPAPPVATPDAGLDAGLAAIVTHLDTPCVTGWIRFDDAPVACAGRRSQVLGLGPASRSLDIARAEGGTLLVGWNASEFADRGVLTLRTLDEESLVVGPEATLAPEARIGEVVGTSLALASQDERFHIAYWVTSDFGSTIRYRQRLADGQLGDEAIIDEVGRSGSLDLGLTSAGAYIAYHRRDDGRFLTRLIDADGELDAPTLHATDRDLRNDARGAIALVIEDDRPHLAWQQGSSLETSQPLYRYRPDAWTVGRPIDNAAPTHVSGVGLDLVVQGLRRAAAYVDLEGGEAEIRIAEWMSSGPVSISTLSRGLALPQPPSRYPLALAVDEFGLYHLVTVVEGRIEYWRQSVPEGAWVRDIVVDEADHADMTGVALAVGPGRRPHVVFTLRSRVFYATIEP